MNAEAFNFSAGPSKIPRVVLLQAQQELLNWHELQSSVMEISHRSADFIELARQSVVNLRLLLNIPDNYKVLFIQGGARGQFACVPLNLLANSEQKALYLNSGYWSNYASNEAERYADIDQIDITSIENNQLATTELNFEHIAEQYSYIHYCPNETISGLEIFEEPKVGDGVLVADMSSNILSRPIDINKYGLIYAGAQKNIGPAGITLVIVREDLIGKAQPITPSIWDYKLISDANSMYNTPPTFNWYICALVFKWLLSQGGLTAIERYNKHKSELLYNAIDSSQFYTNNIALANRSRMNVTFKTHDPLLDTQFIQAAEKLNFLGLKGHPAIGGMRASIYNAMPVKGINALLDFMHQFEQQHNK